MPLIAFLVAFLALPSAAWAAGGTKPETPTLTVSATGSLDVAPDTAFVTMGMETAGPTAAEAQRENSAVMQKVMTRVLELKIDKERIQTSAFTVTPRYKPQPPPRSETVPPLPEIIGFIVSNTMTVEVRDLEKVATVIQAALGAGANHFRGLQWSLRDEQPARLSVLKIAASKAREKSKVLSDALNVKLGRLMTVNEGGHVIRPAPYAARSMGTMEMAGAEPPISSGELKIEATVTLIYEIH